MVDVISMMLSNKYHCVGQVIVKQTYGEVKTQKKAVSGKVMQC